MRSFVPLLACSALVWAGAAHAARPFNTDDARVVDPDGYQIETFVKRQRTVGEREFWFLPAHNPGEKLLGGRVELTLGGIWVNSVPSGDSRAVVAQAKTLLKPLETNGSGYALTLGVLRLGPSGSESAETNPFVNGIGSFSLADDFVVIHTNLGARRDAGAGLTRGTWGTGAEIAFAERLYGIVEAYGERGEKPTRHIGLRFWAVPRRVQIDSTLGFQHSDPDRRFHTIGLRILW